MSLRNTTAQKVKICASQYNISAVPKPGEGERRLRPTRRSECLSLSEHSHRSTHDVGGIHPYIVSPPVERDAAFGSLYEKEDGNEA